MADSKNAIIEDVRLVVRVIVLWDHMNTVQSTKVLTTNE